MIDLLSHFPERWLPHEKCAAVDWAAARVKRKFYVLMTGRSGSTHLVDLMRQTYVLGWPDEYFNERYMNALPQAQKAESFCQYLNLITGYQRGGTFGFKIDIWRLKSLLSLVDFPNIFSPADTALLVMTRQDLLPQAYSFAVARATAAWHDFDGEKAARSYEPGDRELWYELFLLASAETEIEIYIRLSGRNALRFTYEDLVTDRAALLQKICAHVGTEWSGMTAPARKSQTVQKITYAGREKRLEEFRRKFGDLLAEVDANRTAFDWAKMAKALLSEHGIAL